MADFITVAKTVDLKPGQAKTILAAGHQIALFNVAGSFYATSNVCLHMAGPLGRGTSKIMLCPVPITDGSMMSNQENALPCQA